MHAKNKSNGTWDRNTSLARLLSTFRRYRSLSARELSQKAKVSCTYIQQAEKEQIIPKWSLIKRLAQKLELSKLTALRLKRAVERMQLNTGVMNNVDNRYPLPIRNAVATLLKENNIDYNGISEVTWAMQSDKVLILTVPIKTKAITITLKLEEQDNV